MVTAWLELERRFCVPVWFGDDDTQLKHTGASPVPRLDEAMVAGLRAMFRPHRDYLARIAHGIRRAIIFAWVARDGVDQDT